MNKVAESNKIMALRQEVEDVLDELGVDLDLGHNPNIVKARHPNLYLWRIIRALARGIAAQKIVTVEQLEEVDGVGRATAERIVKQLS